MVVVAVGKQNIGDIQIQFVSGLDDGIDIPGRVDYGCAPGSDVFDQVDKILHRSQFHRVNLKTRFGHGSFPFK